MQSPGLLVGFPIVVPVVVQWGDQDAFGHVNNIVYLRWAETARIEYVTRVGIWQRSATEKIGPILASISCNFLRAMTYPDTAHVGASVNAIGNSSFKMSHKVVSANQGVVAVELETTLVLFDYKTGKSVAVPSGIRDAIGKLEGKMFALSPKTR